MAVLDLFSKRQKRLRGEVPDVYVYDALPDRLRVQIMHLWNEHLPDPQFRPIRGEPNLAAVILEESVRTLRKEHGVLTLREPKLHDNPKRELEDFFLAVQHIESALDVVEVIFAFIDALPSGEVAVAELNERFREQGVGYQFEARQIIRIDSQVLHAEAVKPTLRLLAVPGYEGPEQEFLAAHEHHRHGRNKECLVECLKAFESTMKVICGNRGWPVGSKATAKDLIAACFKGGLVQSWMETEFASLRQLLESSVPTLRNKMGGHGQGGAVQQVPAHLAAYGLHMTASTILFLVEADKALGP